MKTLSELEQQKRDLEYQIEAEAYASRTPAQKLADVEAQIAARTAHDSATAAQYATDHDGAIRAEITALARERGAAPPEGDVMDLLVERVRSTGATSVANGALVVTDAAAMQRAGLGFVFDVNRKPRQHTPPAPARLAASVPQQKEGEDERAYASRLYAHAFGGARPAAIMPDEPAEDYYQRVHGRSYASCLT